jgi:hypothetical protein
MESYPELANQSNTPDYDEVGNELYEFWSCGARLSPEQMKILLDSHPELAEHLDRFDKEGPDAA